MLSVLLLAVVLSVLLLVIVLSVLLLAIVLSVLLAIVLSVILLAYALSVLIRFTATEHPFGNFKRFLADADIIHIILENLQSSNNGKSTR